MRAVVWENWCKLVVQDVCLVPAVGVQDSIVFQGGNTRSVVPLTVHVSPKGFGVTLIQAGLEYHIDVAPACFLQRSGGGFLVGVVLGPEVVFVFARLLSLVVQTLLFPAHPPCRLCYPWDFSAGSREFCWYVLVHHMLHVAVEFRIIFFQVPLWVPIQEICTELCRFFPYGIPVCFRPLVDSSSGLLSRLELDAGVNNYYVMVRNARGCSGTFHLAGSVSAVQVQNRFTSGWLPLQLFQVVCVEDLY